MSDETYVVEEVLVAGCLHEVELCAVRVAPGCPRRGGDEEGRAEVVSEQLDAGGIGQCLSGFTCRLVCEAHPMLSPRFSTLRRKRGLNWTFFHTSKLLR